MSKKVRWGIISVAKIGWEKVIPAMQQGEFTEVVAIASREQPRAAGWAERLGIPRAYGSYDELLAIIWRSHNPFGNKGSCQYKSAIWYDPASPSQQASVEASAAALSKAKGGLKVQTCLEPLGPFYLAEEYHQKYIAKQSGGRNGFY